MVMTSKFYRLIQCAGIAIGGAVVCVCGKNYIKEVLENTAVEAHDEGIDDGARIAFKTVDNWLIKAYGVGRAKEIWDDIWPTNRMHK
jgi:hypothetical protein